MTQLITTLGPKRADELGLILAHEHVFVDLRTRDQPGYAQAETPDVVSLMAPEIARAQAVSVTALVEGSTVGVGRRPDILKAVSEATGLPMVVPTGVYREPWTLDWIQAAVEADLCDWMTGELLGEIIPDGVKAGWIKLSVGDDGLTECEAKVLRAAAAAGLASNAVIGGHTIRGRVVQNKLEIIEGVGYSPERFIWIHTQAEPDFELHLEIARYGAWIEYDAIGSDQLSDDFFLNRIQRVLNAGLGDHLLLSHDRGWYDPALPGGGTPKSFTYLSETFLPKLRQVGIAEPTIYQLTTSNPFRAFAR